MRTDAIDQLLAFAAEHDGVFAARHVRRFGVTERQVQRRLHKSWRPLHVGVYLIAGAPLTWKGRLRAACWSTSSLVAVSHRSAAALYELPGGSEDVAEITCARWLRAREPGLIVHESRRLETEDIRTVDEIPAVTPERLLFDLAALRPNANYLEMVIHAARRKRLITYDSAHAVFERHARRGLRGASALRTALETWDPAKRATESVMETRLMQALRRNRMPEPVPQHEIFDASGHFVARTDLAFPQWRIAIEYDSKQEHTDEFQLARDARRRNRIVAAGYVLLVARNDDVKRGATEICDLIDATIRNRRHEPTG